MAASNVYFDFSAPQNVGHFFLAIKPDLFMLKDQYESRMDALVTRAKACPRAAGFDEILMPGEPEARTATKRRRSGIPLTGEVLADLKEEAVAAGLPFPATADEPLDTN